MEIRLNSPYESIQEILVPQELPKLVILTGKNGSGKTHLLEGIDQGHITILENNTQIPTDKIVYVGFGTLNVTGGDEYSSQLAQQACQQVWDNFNSWRQNYVSQGAPGGVNGFLGFIQNYRNVGDPNMERVHTAIEYTVSQEETLPLHRYTKQHFWKHIFDPETSNTEVGFFEQNFAKIFAEYQISLIKQGFYKYMRARGYDHAPEISDDDLETLEANKPWDFVNEILRLSKFDFEVMPPDFWDTEEFTYKIRLRKLSTGAEVEFQRLSTGERVLFALALVRYKAEKRSKSFPALILLDEPDAPLHPAMTETLLDVIQKIFVDRYETSVIMATHSPATVALAPEGSIVVASSDTTPPKLVLQHVGKKEALDTLSSGFVAISTEANQSRVSFEVTKARRPILFVEGPSDKKIIETAWRKLHPSEPQPVDIIVCGDHKQIRYKIDAVSVEDMNDRPVVALMDFDSAFDTFKGLKRFNSIRGSEESGIYRVRTNGANKVVALLLPVPAHRSAYAAKSLGGRSRLAIELLFDDATLVTNDNLTEELQPGGAPIKLFKGNKVTFAEKRVPRFPEAAFVHFNPLFDFVLSQV